MHDTNEHRERASAISTFSWAPTEPIWPHSDWQAAIATVVTSCHGQPAQVDPQRNTARSVLRAHTVRGARVQEAFVCNFEYEVFVCNIEYVMLRAHG